MLFYAQKLPICGVVCSHAAFVSALQLIQEKGLIDVDEKNLEALVCQYYKCGEQIAMAIVACAVKTGNIKNLEEKVGSSDRSDEE